MRLLIVEGNPKPSALPAAVLAEDGFAVDVAPTVQGAEAALQLVAYDALLLDLALPDGDGFDVLQDLRRRGFTLPIRVSTARSASAASGMRCCSMPAGCCAGKHWNDPSTRSTTKSRRTPSRRPCRG